MLICYREGKIHAVCLSIAQRKGAWCCTQGHMSAALKANPITLPALLAWPPTKLQLIATLSLLANVPHARHSLL